MDARECHVERFMSIEFNIFLNLIPSFNMMHNSSKPFSLLFFCFRRYGFLTNFYGKSLKKNLVLFYFPFFARLSRCFVGWNIFHNSRWVILQFLYCCHGSKKSTDLFLSPFCFWLFVNRLFKSKFLLYWNWKGKFNSMM